ncbi:hypothetical protein Leucomu_01630 [Leucobacter muris]|uniref:Sulfatase N-terminal domain-containing protein n=1 Tax=Leucobacter muris TaxID=1935379 RepID=A0ABX5QCQ5_9MICO|nr:hypothetical protein Leucomu_01630 [Leucobacter muris]
MAGIVSTQCGIPLRSGGALGENVDLNELGSEGNEVTSYLPNATCLGDVLAREGYRNVFMGGADADFAGKGAFFRSHGYDEVHDLQEWRAAGETEIRDDWGLSDRRLFERAREEVTRLHEGNQPFNLTLLTLDTHEGPRVYDYCSWDTEEAMTSITFCSMEQVAGFVDYLDETGGARGHERRTDGRSSETAGTRGELLGRAERPRGSHDLQSGLEPGRGEVRARPDRSVQHVPDPHRAGRHRSRRTPGRDRRLSPRRRRRRAPGVDARSAGERVQRRRAVARGRLLPRAVGLRAVDWAGSNPLKECAHARDGRAGRLQPTRAVAGIPRSARGAESTRRPPRRGRQRLG